MLCICNSSSKPGKTLKGFHSIGDVVLNLPIFIILVLFIVVYTFTHQHAHGVGVTHTVYIFLFVGSILLKLLQDFERLGNVLLALFVPSEEFLEGYFELFPDVGADDCGELAVGCFVSEKIEVGFFFLELLSDKIQLIRKLIILLCQLEEILPLNRLNDTVGLCYKLL
jgi:hypothetical protein